MSIYTPCIFHSPDAYPCVYSVSLLRVLSWFLRWFSSLAMIMLQHSNKKSVSKHFQITKQQNKGDISTISIKLLRRAQRNKNEQYILRFITYIFLNLHLSPNIIPLGTNTMIIDMFLLSSTLDSSSGGISSSLPQTPFLLDIQNQILVLLFYQSIISR